MWTTLRHVPSPSRNPTVALMALTPCTTCCVSCTKQRSCRLVRSAHSCLLLAYKQLLAPTQALQEPRSAHKGVVVGKVLELHQHMRPPGTQRRHELVHECGVPLACIARACSCALLAVGGWLTCTSAHAAAAVEACTLVNQLLLRLHLQCGQANQTLPV